MKNVMAIESGAVGGLLSSQTIVQFKEAYESFSKTIAGVPMVDKALFLESEKEVWGGSTARVALGEGAQAVRGCGIALWCTGQKEFATKPCASFTGDRQGFANQLVPLLC